MSKEDIARERARAWYRDNKERKKAYDLVYNTKNRAKKNAQSRKWVADNYAKRKEIMKADYRKFKGRVFASCAARRARVAKALPSWLTKEQRQTIRLIYENRPEGYHVDHIVPIKGKNVSGLHVPWNLQYLPALENFSKGNKYV